MRYLLLLILLTPILCYGNLGVMDSGYVSMPTDDYRRMYAGWKQSVVCDSLIQESDSIINHRDVDLMICKEVIEIDSLEKYKLNQIIDIADTETKKQKRLKFLVGGLGIIGIILLLL